MPINKLTVVPSGGRARGASTVGRRHLTDVSAQDPGSRIWILTDRRYMGQRMPLALVEWLRARGHTPVVVIGDDDDRGVLSRVTPLAHPVSSAWAGLRRGDLVVGRSRHPFALALLEEAEGMGARILNGGQAVHRVRDKATCALALARRGLPVPGTLLVRRPADLAQLPDCAFPLVVKPVYGDNAQGVSIVATRDELAGLSWSEELFIAQAYVDAGGFDLKVYVAGDRVWATRRPSPLRDPLAAGERVPVTPELRRIAHGCRDEFGLELFGVDVLQSEEGLAIVDVNEFPNYTGVAEAPEAIGSLLLASLPGHRSAIGANIDNGIGAVRW